MHGTKPKPLNELDGSIVDRRLYALYVYISNIKIRALIYLVPILVSLNFLGAGHDDTWIMLFAGETLGRAPWFLNHNGIQQEISTSVLGAVLAGAASAAAPGGEAYAFVKIFAWIPAMLAGIGVFEILRKACGQGPAAYWLLVMCCVPQWHYWAWGGAESGLFWLGVVSFACGLAFFSVRPGLHSGFLVALLAALLPLVRADALWAPLSLIYFAVFMRGVPAWLKWMPSILAIGVTAGFHMVRHAMTGAWLPNPAYAKATMSLDSIGYGIEYLTQFHMDSPLHAALAFSIPLSALGGYRLLRKAEETSTFQSRLFEWSGVLVLTIDLTTVMVGGDWMGEHRFAVRSLPLKIMILALWANESFRHGALSNLDSGKKQMWVRIFLIVAVSGLTASGVVSVRGNIQGSQNLPAQLFPWQGLTHYFIQRNGPSLRDTSAVLPWIEKNLPSLVEKSRLTGNLPLKVASYQGGFFPMEVRRHYSPREVLFIDLGGLSDYRIGKLQGPRSPLGLEDGVHKWAQALAYKQGGLGQFLANCQPDVVYVLKTSNDEIELMQLAGYRFAYQGRLHFLGKTWDAASVFVWDKQEGTGPCAPLGV